MIRTTTHYNERLYKALSQIHHIETPQLISVTEQMETANPFHFYQAGKAYQGERVYWASTDQVFTLVGIGSAYTLEAEEDRFNTIQQAWKALIEEAVIDNPYESSGTGPVALGGFSFDPHDHSRTVWEDFPDSKVSIPMFLLTKTESANYMTVNIMVHPEDDIEDIYQFVTQAYQEFLEGRTSIDEMPSIIGKEEIQPLEWKDIVKQAAHDIQSGYMSKVVLARELEVNFDQDVNIVSVLDALQQEQQQSYVFAIESGDSCFLGATPERLVKVDNRELHSACLAGTIARGNTAEEDQALGEELLHDNKNLQEHDFVVQMIREAVESCCDQVQIPSEPVIYPLRNLQHLYTPVQAKLRVGYTILEVVEKLHPTPALNGYPRQEALSYIREHEPFDRGWYASPVGWFDYKDNGEFAVAIRSGLVKRNKTVLYSGCGIVEDSMPEAEYEETAIKFLPMLNALGGKT